MNTITTRRTIRRYADRDVEPTLLSQLLSQASRTQTMGNLQLYSVVITRSAEGKAKLLSLYPSKSAVIRQVFERYSE